MLRPLLGISEDDLERQLLRRGVGLLVAGRHACADCKRSPLIGERVYRYQRGVVVCELCRPGHPGEPQSSSLVHHSERGQTVRILAARAA